MRPVSSVTTQERVARQQLLHLEVRDRLAWRVGVERVAERIVAVAADRRLDRAAPRPRPPDDERDVLTRECTRVHELLKAPVRLRRARDDEQPRGVAVEPVHDPGPVGLLPALDVVGEQPVHERSGRMPGRRMDDERPQACRRRAGARPRTGPTRSIASGVSVLAAVAGGSNSSSSPPSSRGSSAARGRRRARRPRAAAALRPRGSRSRAARRGSGRAARRRRCQERAAASRRAARGAARARPRASRRAGSRRR